MGPGKTLVTGHVVVRGWYVAMARALAAPQGTDKEAASWKDRVHELLQCALTVTVHVRLGLTAAQRATWSIQISEQRKGDNKLADTFPMFAAKAWVALGPGDHRKMSQQKLLDTLRALQINFDNLTLNKVMVGYVVDFADDSKWSPRCAEILQWIERDCGVDVLSAGYAKLGKIIQICGKAALASSQRTGTLVECTLGYL